MSFFWAPPVVTPRLAERAETIQNISHYNLLVSLFFVRFLAVFRLEVLLVPTANSSFFFSMFDFPLLCLSLFAFIFNPSRGFRGTRKVLITGNSRFF